MAVIWVLNEETALLEFLVDHKAEAGDNGNFKKATMVRAALHITPLLAKGPKKDATSCQNKYNVLRKTARIVAAVMQVLGFTWDDITGASIGPESVSVWDDYIAKHPAAKPFRNKGWIHREKMALLMSSSDSTVNVHHPLATIRPSSSLISVSGHDDTLGESDGDDNTSDDEITVLPASTTSSTSSRKSVKREREPATPIPSSKRVRTSAASSAMQAMVESLDRFGAAIAASLAPLPNALEPTPRRRINAMSTARKMESSWISKQQMVELINVFQSDTAACDVYLDLAEGGNNLRELLMAWVQKQINLPSLLTPL